MGVVEKREPTKIQQIYKYSITGERFKIDLELPTSLSTLQVGQKVKVALHTSEPKTSGLITLRGQVYGITKEKGGSSITVFFGGLQGVIQISRAHPSLKPRKTIYLSIMEG